MKSKKTFVTIFTAAENFHLVKDVGQIPYFMYKIEGYAASLVCYKNNSEYPYLNQEVKGLKLRFIRNFGRLFYFEAGVIKYLLSSSKAIDILNLFHFKKDNLFYLLVYKLLNRKGKAFIKLDVDLLFFKQYNAFFYSRNKLKNYFLKHVTSWIFGLTDLISIETEDGKEYLLKVYPQLQDKLICIPNGVDDLYLEQIIKVKPFHEKENIILTVGRIGTFQKNTTLFLEALAMTDLKDWKVYILGPIEESFTRYINQFFEKYPYLRDQVIFTGNISDRKELFEWYNKAKIFCLTSRFEGFPVTFPEALYFGNYIISTTVSGAEFVTDNGRSGVVAEGDVSGLSKAIQHSIAPGFLKSQKFEDIKQFSKENFIWSGIINSLSNRLRQDA